MRCRPGKSILGVDEEIIHLLLPIDCCKAQVISNHNWTSPRSQQEDDSKSPGSVLSPCKCVANSGKVFQGLRHLCTLD